MSKNQFKIGDKVKFVFSKKYFSASPYADDKEYAGEIESIQENGNCTVNFIQNGEEVQVSLPSKELTAAS